MSLPVSFDYSAASVFCVSSSWETLWMTGFLMTGFSLKGFEARPRALFRKSRKTENADISVGGRVAVPLKGINYYVSGSKFER